jgi:hypothetical protein
MKKCLPIIFLVLLASCTANENQLAKAWIYNDEQTGEGREIVQDHSGPAHQFSAANFIDLQPDSTYTAYFTSFDHGKWYFKENNVILVNSKKQVSEFAVNKVDGKEMICTGRADHITLRLNGYKNKFEGAVDNPFSVENNRWRLKPSHPESDKEISERLKDHFRFWEKYFQWGIDSKVSYLDVRSTPSVLKMYGNGFELEYFDNQFPEWKNNFYDSADCWKAYEKIYYLMYQKNVKWPKTKNRFEGFVSAFQQLQQWMDIDPKTYMKNTDTLKAVSRKK